MKVSCLHPSGKGLSWYRPFCTICGWDAHVSPQDISDLISLAEFSLWTPRSTAWHSCCVDAKKQRQVKQLFSYHLLIELRLVNEMCVISSDSLLRCLVSSDCSESIRLTGGGGSVAELLSVSVWLVLFRGTHKRVHHVTETLGEANHSVLHF